MTWNQEFNSLNILANFIFETQFHFECCFLCWKKIVSWYFWLEIFIKTSNRFDGHSICNLQRVNQIRAAYIRVFAVKCLKGKSEQILVIENKRRMHGIRNEKIESLCERIRPWRSWNRSLQRNIWGQWIV